ncbi:MAG: hypothetical protein ACJ75B_09580 [Flavisolibacter sp.]
MKKTSLLARFLTAGIFISLALFGCKKELSNSLSPGQEEEAATASSESETETELVFNDVFDNVMGVNEEVGISGTGIFGRINTSSERDLHTDSVHCYTVTIVRLNAPEPFPVKITVDFGNGCTGNDGHRRYGKIITEYTGRLTIPGKSATTRFDGFRIDDISVQGTHKITNTTTSNHTQFTVDVTEAKLSKPNGNYAEWTAHRVITQLEGNATPSPIDDIFKIEGSGHGRVQHNTSLYAWQSEIIEPLRKKFTCHWISQGTIRIKRETLPDNSQWAAILDYGNGDCDYHATLTINGQSHQIELPH